ncbi:MAG: glycosyltransferase family 4 protein [Acidobacteriia bacterium]|nr:glycosyltransferase family 4 protein [Terriglobia bacterium]
MAEGPLRVVVEAAALGISSGGLPRYTGELSCALARCFPQDQFFLASDQPFSLPPNSPGNLRRGGGPCGASERRWWLWGLSREAMRLKADIIHGPDFAVPYLPLKPSVLTLHDLSPWMDQRWHYAAARVKRRTPVLLALRIPTLIVTVSEGVRKQAIERFHLSPDRIVSVPLAAPGWLRPVQSRPERPYFLHVGTLEPRKNLIELVRAWQQITRDGLQSGDAPSIDLILAGRRRKDAPEFSAAPGLRLLGEVPDSQLAELYSGALACVYPSLYEGFGLPVLEAMQCGACVIASSAVREAGGHAAVYADNTAELACAMRRAASEPDWLAARRELSLARAREFSWEQTARATYEVYQEARKRFGR